MGREGGQDRPIAVYRSGPSAHGRTRVVIEVEVDDENEIENLSNAIRDRDGMKIIIRAMGGVNHHYHSERAEWTKYTYQ